MLICKKMELAIHITAVQRQEVIGIGLPRHAIDAEVPDHLDGAVLHVMGMKIRRPEFDIEVGHLAPYPPTNDVIPGLVRAGHIALRRIFALSGTTRQDDAGKTPLDMARTKGEGRDEARSTAIVGLLQAGSTTSN